MEVTQLMIYAVGIIDNLREVFGVTIVAIIGVQLLIEIMIEDAGVSKWFLKHIAIPLSVVSALFLIFVPNSKTLGAMYVIPAVANNEKIQNIGKNGLESLELLTKQWVDELREEKSKEDK